MNGESEGKIEEGKGRERVGGWEGRKRGRREGGRGWVDGYELWYGAGRE